MAYLRVRIELISLDMWFRWRLAEKWALRRAVEYSTSTVHPGARSIYRFWLYFLLALTACTIRGLVLASHRLLAIPATPPAAAPPATSRDIL